MPIEKKRKRSELSAKSESKAEPEKRAPMKSSLLKADEAFPRGGGSTLTPLEYKEVTKEAKRDVLFEEKSAKGIVQSKKRKNKGGISQSEAKGRDGPKIEGLSFKRMKPGLIILGQVISITRAEMTVALPNNLFGTVSAAHVSSQLAQDIIRASEQSSDDEDTTEEAPVSSLKDLFAIHQWLRVAIVSVNKGQIIKGKKERRSIELSIEPALVNIGITKETLQSKSTVQASIESVEDHGVVVDIGIDGLKGFIKKKEISSDSALKRGQVVLCNVVSAGNDRKVIQFTPQVQRDARNAKLKSIIDITAVLPGDAIEVVVSQANDSSFTGKVGGLLDATCDVFQADLARKPRKLEEGQKLLCRCLFVDTISESRKIGVSLLQHVLDLSHPSTKKDSLDDPTIALPTGYKLDHATVTHVESKYGLFCDIGLENMQGFTHISRISESKIDALSAIDGKYKVKSQHPARVVGYSPVDGLLMLSFESKVIASEFLSVADVVIGSVVEGTVHKFVDGGFLLSLSDTVTGFVPEGHFADVKLQYPEKKFKIGSKLKCRVLNVNIARHRVNLTAKKTMLNSDEPILTKYEDIHIGSKSTGVVSKLLDNGALIQFYGGVHGFLPIGEMSEAYIANTKEHFKIGQALTVRVLSVDSDNHKLTVSCRDPSVWDTSKVETFTNITPGTIVSGTITDKTKDKLVLLVKPGDFNATIEVGHLSDGDLSKCDKILERARIGGHIKEAVVLTRLDDKKLLSISSKSSLIAAARTGSLLKTFSEVAIGKKVQGYVKKITDYGVVIGFADNLTALALKNNLSDEYVSVPSALFHTSQSVTCTICNIEADQERFQVTFKKAVEKQPSNNDSESNNGISLGQVVGAVVTSVKETQLNIQLTTANETFRGRVDISSIFETYEAIEHVHRPLKSFNAHQQIKVRVIGLHDARNYKYLPLTHKTSNTKLTYECTLKPSEVQAKNVAVLKFDDIEEGTVYTAFVNNISADCLWVNLSPLVRGRISLLDLEQEIKDTSDLEEHYPVGTAIKCRAIHFVAATKHLDLSEKAINSKQIVDIRDVKVGEQLPAKITRVSSAGLLAQLSPTVSGRIALTDLSDNYQDEPTHQFTKNQLINVVVKHVDVPNKKIFLSLREGQEGSDNEINSIDDLKVGGKYRGYIKNVASQGLFVELGRTVIARVKIAETSDAFVKDWQSMFTVDQLVSGTVTAIDEKAQRVEFSLKKYAKASQIQTGLSELAVGQVIEATVKKIESFGIFLQVNSATAVSGLCHQSEIADHHIKDLKSAYSVGDLVKAKILDIQLEKRRISFGMKASYFTNQDDDDDGSSAGFEESDAEMQEVESESDDDVDEVMEAASENSMLSDEGDELDDDQGPVFDWTADSVFEPTHAQEESDVDSQPPLKKKKKSKKSYDDTPIDFDAKTPDSVSDFERLLLGQPDSAAVWIQYMAFHMQSSEVEKAREIGERAISTINYRREEEKLNVWVAMLNLENNFGTEESLDKVFRKSCEFMDPKEMYSKLIGTFIRAGKVDRADASYQEMLKKFSQSPKLYPEYAKFLIDNNNIEAARDLLPRALQVLPKSEHVGIMQKFAQIEFQHGDSERGRTLFEGLLSNYPKRLDIWNVLIDMETQQSNFSGVRQIFDRLISTKLSEKKAKSIFKKWLRFESDHGTEDDQEAVKLRATEYVSLHFR